MSLLSKIEKDLVTAQKEKNTLKISILRFLMSKLYNAQILKGKHKPLKDYEAELEIKAEIRRHKESIEAYTKADRSDLAEKEKLELVILENYLPKQLTEPQISKIVKDVILRTDASGVGDFGKVMGAVMSQVSGRADGKLVSDTVRKKLVGQ